MGEIDPRTLHDEPHDAPGHLRFLAEKIIETVVPSDVISQAVRLRQEGGDWRGLSPFAADREPGSLFVNDEARWFFCVLTRRRGNVVAWTMSTGDGMAFDEAVRHLASRFLGVKAVL